MGSEHEAATGTVGRLVAWLAMACLVVGGAVALEPPAASAAPAATAAPSSLAHTPAGITSGPDGNLWFTTYETPEIGRITPSGSITYFGGPGISTPDGIVSGPDGALWFTNFGNDSIGRITTGGTVTNYTGPGISQPHEMAVGADGAMWFTNFGNDTIGRITTDGTVTNYTGTGIRQPYWIAAGPDGAVWFTNLGNDSIGRITTGGIVSNLTGPGISQPKGIAAGPGGAAELWFANSGNGSIGRITTGGAVSNHTGPGIGGTDGVISGPDGNVWFCNTSDNSIGRITPGGQVSRFTDASVSAPDELTVGPDGAIWFTNFGNDTIGRITTSGAITHFTDPSAPPPPPAPGPNPPPTTASGSPFGALDGARWDGPGTVNVSGWAIDPDTTGPVDVHVYVNGRFAGATTAATSRPDVAGAFPGYGPDHGYAVDVPAPAGIDTVCTYGINQGRGGNNLLACRTVAVAGANPFGALDAARWHGPGTVNVAGWAIDPDSTGPVDVHVYVNGRFAGATTAAASRPDVAGAFPGYGPDHGYAVDVPAPAGDDTVCTYGINAGGTPGGNNLLACRTVTVPGANPFGALDDVRRAADGSVTVSGWGIDPDTSAPIDVHVYVNGRGAGATTAGHERSDVAAAFPGYGSGHGYRATVAAPAGPLVVCTYGINAGGTPGSNDLLGCRVL